MATRSGRRTRRAGAAPKRRTAAARGDPQIHYHPATPERWRDLEQLFGPRGACGGCRCMWLRLSWTQFEQHKGDGNKQALEGLVAAGRIPGVLAYHEGRPVGWCSVAPREEFPRLEASRTLRRIDDRPVWSVVCFYVARPWRRRGITVGLLKAAVAYARQQGAAMVEGYPVAPRVPDMPAVFAWPGLVAAFRRVGFTEVARRSATRLIMRMPLRTPRGARSRLSSFR
jgi:GNAT superfamily N-acetyltransferase